MRSNCYDKSINMEVKKITCNLFNVFIYGLVYKTIAKDSVDAKAKALKKYIKDYKPKFN